MSPDFPNARRSIHGRDGVTQKGWETFRAVAEIGSITGAARVLHLSQSSVSQHIQQLEDEYGVPLLVRYAHGVRLTPAGDVLYRYVVKLLRVLDESRDQIRSLSAPGPERLTVAASFTIAEYVLPELLARLYQPTAHGRVALTMHNSAAVLALVARHEVELGLVESEVERADLVRHRFATDKPQVMVGAHHRWASAAHIGLEEFLREPVVLREPGSGTRAALEDALHAVGRGIDDMSVSFVLSTTQAIKAMVRAGFGSTVLSPLCLAPHERKQFHTVEVDGLILTRSFYAVHLPVRLSAAARRLLALLMHGAPP
jgi:DNA-binding transcriptional LysR family regulator